MKTCISMEEWIDVWGTIVGKAKRMDDFPMWLQYYPKVLFDIINRSGMKCKQHVLGLAKSGIISIPVSGSKITLISVSWIIKIIFQRLFFHEWMTQLVKKSIWIDQMFAPFCRIRRILVWSQLSCSHHDEGLSSCAKETESLSLRHNNIWLVSDSYL